MSGQKPVEKKRADQTNKKIHLVLTNGKTVACNSEYYGGHV